MRPEVARGNRTQPNVAKREEIHGADATRMRWRRILDVNVTIEIRSLVSEAAKHLKLAMASRRAASSGNTSLIVTFSSFRSVLVDRRPAYSPGGHLVEIYSLSGCLPV